MSNSDIELGDAAATGGKPAASSGGSGESFMAAHKKMLMIIGAVVVAVVVATAVIAGAVVATSKDDNKTSGGSANMVAGNGAGMKAAPDKATVVQSGGARRRRRAAIHDPEVMKAARDALAASSPGLGEAFASLAFSDPGTDYSSAVQSFNVYHPATQPMDSINVVLCLVAQMRVETFVNQGKYIALVDQGRCSPSEAGSSSSSSSGGGSSEGSLELVRTINEATRLDDSSSQFMISWYGEGDELVRIFLETKGAPTVDNPFGDFELTYKMTATGTPFGDMRAIASIGTVPVASGSAYRFFIDISMSNNGVSMQLLSSSAVVEFDPTSDGGSAFVRSIEPDFSSGLPSGSGPIPTTETWYALKYDASYALIQEADSFANIPRDALSGRCLDLTSEKEYPWSYELYDATTGAVINFNGGFPFNYNRADVTAGAEGTGFGYASHWGVWIEDGASLPDGTVITRADGSDATTYSVSTSNGKLTRNTVVRRPVAEISQIKFSYYLSGTGSVKIQYLTTPSAGWFATYSVTYDSSGSSLTPISPPTAITVPSSGLYLYAYELGGSVIYNSGDTHVVYSTEEKVTAADPTFFGDSTIKDLYCLGDCPKAVIDSTSYNGNYLTQPTDIASAITYTIDPASGTALKYNGVAISMAAGVETSVTSGVLVTSTAGLSSISDATDTAGDVTYEYRISSYSWTQTVTLTTTDGSNTIVTFDEPIQFDYTHSTANDRNNDPTHNGLPAILSYGGSLWGIPYEQVDSNGDGVPDRYSPSFALKDGVALGSYVVKALFGDIILGTATVQTCAANSLAITNPVVPVPTAFFGAALMPHENLPVPDITDDPKVIAGDIVGSFGNTTSRVAF